MSPLSISVVSSSYRNRLCQFFDAPCRTFSYVGNSDWLSTVTLEGNSHQRYLYVNGKPLRMDDPSHYQNPSYYFRYNARGDAAAVVQKNGDGGTSWTNFGAWGDMNYTAIGYYGWNAAWGYMQFPANLNFNMHDAQDMGLYFAHGRWYNQETGLWLSPNDKGDYLYTPNSNPIGDAWADLNKFRYIRTRGFGYIDRAHFYDAADRAQEILAYLEAHNPPHDNLPDGRPIHVCKGPNNLVCIDFDVRYEVKNPVPKELWPAVALGIYSDLQYRWEELELYGLDFGASGFAIEDFPSDYLGFYSGLQRFQGNPIFADLTPTKGNPGIIHIVSVLGGRVLTTDEPPRCNLFTGDRDFCDQVKNRDPGWRPLVFAPRIGWSNINWPKEFQMVPPVDLTNAPFYRSFWRPISCHATLALANNPVTARYPSEVCQ